MSASDVAKATKAAQQDSATTGHTAAGRGLEALPFRVLGALLLVGSLDPPHWPDTPSLQWLLGLVAACAGFWAGVPITDRPVIDSYTWPHRIQRHRNTLLAAVAVFLAALQSPPAWLTAVEILLLLGYLTVLDAGAAAARPPRIQAAQALWAAAASALVLLCALAPVTGGSSGRLVAGLCVAGTLGLLGAALRLRRPAGHVRTRTPPRSEVAGTARSDLR